MEINIRQGKLSDAEQLCRLQHEFMREYFQMKSTVTTDQIEQDGFGKHFEVIVADHHSSLVGFAVWHTRYDFHHCVRGAYVSDLFVRPKYRGKGIAPMMLAEVAKDVSEKGGTFICGQGSDKTKKLYERIAVGFSGTDCYVFGKAFSVLCNLSGKSLREFVKNLPHKEWNYETPS